MKKLVKTTIFFLILAVLAGCKSREKAVQKSETQTEKKSEATARIQEQTFEITSSKELSKFDKSKTDKAEETSKTETKNVEIIKEYYENGTLKKEMQRNFSELAETTKKAISELEEKFTKEKENSRYWENSSNHFYTALEQEKTKTKDYAMQLKAKESFAWQLFAVGLFLGWLLLPKLFQWLFSWVKRFQPYIALVELGKTLIKKILLNKNTKKL
ncbi:MAG: hypothetical protein KAY28_04435 [Cloacibacterium sp.]|nr:hypothetical protein [Cloacibacterium sp.]